MPGFTIPGAAAISRSGANLTSQAGNIATQTAGNLGNIQMTIANAKAAGIVEGSRAFSEMLNRLGVTAQQFPIIKQQMEDREQQRGLNAQRSTLQGQNIEANQLAIAETKEKAEALEVLRGLVAENPDPQFVLTRTKELGLPIVGQDYAERVEKAKLERVNLGVAEGRAYDAQVARMARILSPLANRDRETEVPVEQLNALYQSVRGEIEKVDPSFAAKLPVDFDPFADALIQVQFAAGTATADKIKLAAKPTLSDRGKRLREYKEQQISLRGLPRTVKTDGLLIKEFNLAEQARTGTADERAIINEEGRPPTVEELRRESPEAAELRKLRIEGMRTTNELARARLSERGQITTPQFLAISKAARADAKDIQARERLLKGTGRLLEGTGRPLEEIYQEELRKSLKEIGGFAGGGTPVASQVPDRQILEQARVGETVTLSDGRKFKKSSTTKFDAVP